MNRSYAHENLKDLVTKTSVSELKKAQMDLEFAQELFPQKEAVPYVPAFMQEEQELSGADRGSAYHRVMELLDFVKVLEASSDGLVAELKRQISSMVDQELLQKQWGDAVSIKKLLRFFQSDLAQRMAEAQRRGKLKKEQPFVLGIAADRLKSQFPHEEQVLIQGIIDAFFEEGDELILMDYKTDAVKTGEELVKRYHTQMEYYTEALERITGKHVRQRIIYSFALGEEILL